MDITIQSTNRITGSLSSSDFIINLPFNVDFGKVTLAGVIMPNSIYKIRQDINDRVCWRRSSTNYSYQIPAGSYSISELLSTIQTGMNAADSNSYSWSYSGITLKCTVTGSGSFMLNWATNTFAAYGCWFELGFTNVNTTTSTSITSTNIIGLYNPTSIYLQVPQLGSPGIISSGVWYTFKLPLTTLAEGIQEVNMTNYIEQSINFSGRKNLQQLNVKLIYANGSAVDLNGADWEFTLRFC